MWIVLAVVALAAILGIVTTFFHRATVTVTPHRYTAQVESTFETSPAHPLLPYERVSVEETLTKTVPATGSRHVENHASGIITVHNAFSQNSVRLITNTRFESADGKIYRVHTPVSVPGYTMKAGVKVPGTVDVTVYAAEAGESHNVGLTEFTLPGLTNPEEHEQIYARSKTPITGGFVGEQAVVDASVRTQTIEALKADLDRNLRAKVATASPPGSVIFPDTVLVTFAEKTDTAEGDNAVIGVSGTAVAPAFPMQSLAKAVADAGGVFSESVLSIENVTELSGHINSPDALGSETPVSLAVSGSAKLVAVFDTEGLARDLAGKGKDAIHTVLPGYPGIADLTIRVYPFWLSTIPTNSKDVEIKVAEQPDGLTP